MVGRILIDFPERVETEIGLINDIFQSSIFESHFYSNERTADSSLLLIHQELSSGSKK